VRNIPATPRIVKRMANSKPTMRVGPWRASFVLAKRIGVRPCDRRLPDRRGPRVAAGSPSARDDRDALLAKSARAAARMVAEVGVDAGALPVMMDQSLRVYVAGTARAPSEPRQTALRRSILVTDGQDLAGSPHPLIRPSPFWGRRHSTGQRVPIPPARKPPSNPVRCLACGYLVARERCNVSAWRSAVRAVEVRSRRSR